MGLTRFGDWARVAQITSGMGAKMALAAKTAMLREAHYLRGKMVQGIASQAPGGRPFRPLSPLTLAVRRFGGFGGSKALIQSGALRGAITVVSVGGTGPGGRVFVGVHRNARGKDGKSLYNLAELHEQGGGPWPRKLSPKARRFLFAAIKAAGLNATGALGRDASGRFKREKAKVTGVGVFAIPARPFVGPTLDAHAKPEDVRRRFIDSMLTVLGGDFRLLGGGK